MGEKWEKIINKEKENRFHKKAIPDISGIQWLASKLTNAEPALVDVHSKGSDEARLQVVL